MRIKRKRTGRWRNDRSPIPFGQKAGSATHWITRLRVVPIGKRERARFLACGDFHEASKMEWCELLVCPGNWQSPAHYDLRMEPVKI